MTVKELRKKVVAAKRLDKSKMKCNAPRRTPSHPTKSHVVKACQGGKEKIIRFGEQGASTAGKPKKGESAKMKAKRKSFKMKKNPCWKGYEMIGMKKKGGKKVPNCVPKKKKTKK